MFGGMCKTFSICKYHFYKLKSRKSKTTPGLLYYTLLRKCMLSLWLQKSMIWVSEQGLVDQANTNHRDSWVTELEIEELEKKVTGSDNVIVEEARSVGLCLIM